MIALDINDNVLVEQRKVLEQALSTNPKTQKALQKLIRQVVKQARTEVVGGIKFKDGDPRGAAQAVRTAVYKKILGANLNIYSSSDEDAFELAKRGAVDILTLDDPLIAYERDINFMPIAYDYLVLVSSPESRNVESISDLEGLDFVGVNGSAQRLAWNSLSHYDIKYNITERVNSQFDAFKMVRNSKNLYTFLNASYFKGDELLKYDTQHVISVIKVNDDKPEIDEFIRFLLNDGQKSIEKQGFTPMG